MLLALSSTVEFCQSSPVSARFGFTTNRTAPLMMMRESRSTHEPHTSYVPALSVTVAPDRTSKLRVKSAGRKVARTRNGVSECVPPERT